MSNIVSKEVRRRGFFGWLFLLLFIGFNLLMFCWLWSYWELLSTRGLPTSDAGRAGAAIGTALGTGAILFIWLVGAVITGLFAILSRGKRVYIHVPTERSTDSDARACPHCAERIKREAIVCRYCGRDVAPSLHARRHPPRPKALRNATICFIAAGGISIIFAVLQLGKPSTLPTVAGVGDKKDQVVNDVTATELVARDFATTPIDVEAQRRLARANLEMIEFKWHKGGFDNVMLATFSFHNKNQFDVKDITVICEHSSPSGTKIDSNTRTIYELIRANGKKPFASSIWAGFTRRQSVPLAGLMLS